MRQALALPELAPVPAPPVRGRLDEDAKRAFLRMISHELRTPLNSIIGFSEVLREEICGPLGSPQYKQYAAFINESGHKMLKMVNQIVEIVRLESQAEALDIGHEPLDLAVGEAIQMLAGDARAAGVCLVPENLDDMPAVAADSRALRTVMLNLMQNAIAHSPSGESVRIVARQGGEQVMIDVVDRGAGFDPVDLARLMRPFEQGSPR